MPSVQGSASDASANGVNTPDLDVELGADTTGGPPLDDEWTPEYARQVALDAHERGNDVGTLPRSLILDPDLTPSDLRVLLAMSLWAHDGRMTITQYALAKNLGITRQSVSRAMHKAIASGLLQRLEIDGAVHWRMRWAMPFKRQPVADAQRQPVADSQPVADVTRTRTHAELTPVRTTKSSSKELSLTDDERRWLHLRYDARIGPVFVDEQIELCLGYKTTKNHKNLKLACSNWLVKACKEVDQARAAKKNAEAAEARARTASGENPNLTKDEPWPGFVRWATDIPQSRDRTRD